MSISLYVMPSEPRTVGQLFDDAVKLYRAAWRTTWILALAAELSVSIPSIYWQLHADPAAMEGSPQALVAQLQSPTLWLLSAIAIPLYLMFYTALIASVNWVATGQAGGFGRAVGIGISLWPRALLLGLLIFCIVVLGLILLVVPGFYWGGTLQLSFVALVLEDTGVTGSMAVSQQLIKGHWWRSATLYSFVVIIALIVSLVIGVVSGILFAVTGSQPATLAAAELVSLMGGTLVAPLFPAVLVALYHDLKLREQRANSGSGQSAA